ncbi:IS4 family transposase [Bacillus sp. SJS]|uniref:IS4 family transposase n=1 Tax=Bacillus sp. SJS TaxID=1423321 RepID=UPI00068B7A11|nr:IS4 family transposase [Bacillus sp. SJS]KZZ85093.1 transposase [Bacillus sp. SJS]
MSKSIGQLSLICQCLSLLPMEDFECPLLDYDKDKLSTSALMKIMVCAQLDQWNSYSMMEEKLRANPELREHLGIKKGISGSQLSRRINDLPTELVQKLFVKVIEKLKLLSKKCKGSDRNVGRLAIVDSTELRLPHQLCKWTRISKGHTAVKMHTRLNVVSSTTVFPDKIVPSTGKVGDVETGIYMVEDPNVTHLMDRAYPSTKNLMDWQKRKIKFIARVRKNLRLYTQESYKTTHPRILRDEKIHYGVTEDPLRYVEFIDEKERVYRILTTRFDLTDQEVMDTYKQRWMIELFFKWIKGHLRLTKVWSKKPQGIWNQMFLALIAYAVTLMMRITMSPSHTQWEFFRILQCYWFQPVCKVIEAIKRPKKKSKGRQKVPDQPHSDNLEELFIGTVAHYKAPGKK